MDQPISQPAGDGIVAKQGWSWGGAVFSPYFIVGARRHALLWWYLFAFVPFLNIVFWVAVFFYFGSKGHQVAANGAQFANQSEYDGYVKGLDHAGKIFFWIFIALMICVALWVVAFFGAYVSRIHQANLNPANAPMQPYYPQ